MTNESLHGNHGVLGTNASPGTDDPPRVPSLVFDCPLGTIPGLLAAGLLVLAWGVGRVRRQVAV